MMSRALLGPSSLAPEPAGDLARLEARTAELLDRLQRLEQIIDSIADGVFVVDRHLLVRSISPGLERLLGLAASQAIGRPCAEVLAGTRCESDCPIRRTLEYRAVVERCREVVGRADGARVPISITTAFLDDASGAREGLLAVVRDESEVERLRAAVADRVGPPDGVEGNAGAPPGAGAAAGANELRAALERHRWNASRTAVALGISRTTLWRRMRAFGLLSRH